jgi:hypothetical protein
MKILNSKVHGYLDYAVVVLFLAAPTVLGLSGLPAIISYALAVVHLLVTVTTIFPLGMLRLLPLRLHGIIELVVAPTLIALPWILGFSSNLYARNFYVATGALIFVVWSITDYRTASRKTAPDLKIPSKISSRS